MRSYGRKNDIKIFKCLKGFCGNFHQVDSRGRVIEDQTLFIVDEAQIMYNSRTWQDPNRLLWVDFFTQHRKYGFTPILVAQSERLIDRQIRVCFEYDVNHKKINNFKKFGKLLGFLCGGNLFIYVTHWYGVTGKDNKVDANYFVGRQKYYDLYNTSKIFDEQE